MSRVYVCSPFRGLDGQPSEANRVLARKLMRAVFDAGHSPFVPHLLFPQVLTESEVDLEHAFRANFAFLDCCDEIWIYAKDLGRCSKGMRAEVERCVRMPVDSPEIVFMPPAFVKVYAEYEAQRQAYFARGL